jgi:hypothetical protein
VVTDANSSAKDVAANIRESAAARRQLRKTRELILSLPKS